MFFSGAAQLALFAGVMLLAAIFMLRERTAGEPAAPPRPQQPAVLLAFIVVEGLAVGVLTGLVGVGGGFLIVPALVLLGLPMKQAVGTSLLVISLKSFAGFAGYLSQVDVYWGFMAGFTAVAVAGIWIGAHLVQFVSQRALKRAFAVLLIVMGVWILYQNRSVFRPDTAVASGPVSSAVR